MQKLRGGRRDTHRERQPRTPKLDREMFSHANHTTVEHPLKPQRSVFPVK